MTPPTPRSSRFMPWTEEDVPKIEIDESFQEVVSKLSHYISKAVDTAYSYEQLRTTIAGQNLRPLVLYLSEDCHHPALVAALLAARYAFDNNDNSEDPRLTDSRALACELVAGQFLTFLSEKELIDHLLYELPVLQDDEEIEDTSLPHQVDGADFSNESSPLLTNTDNRTGPKPLQPPKRPTLNGTTSLNSTQFRELFVHEESIAKSMAGMNALEIAAVSNSKKFLSQKQVQFVVEDIWNGDIIFWDSLSTLAKKSPKIYNKRTADPFSRLRVPKYQKAFQVAFFAAFLVLYYAVLVQRSPRSVTWTEVLLYIWIAAFAYDEFGEFRDAGYLFYQTDFWTIWDLAIILVGIAFFVTRIVGLVKNDASTTDIAFDVLSMLALFLVPRICSVASLNPYFGSLLPVLKEMTTAFCKFLPVILILYLGFLTTFTMLARDRLSLNEVSWLLVKVFFGSSYLGFDFAVQISPIFGYTLMVIFVALTNILLLTALVSLVSNSLTEVMAHAREEYLFQYSIYVLESCTSRRLTYFLPPTNLIPLLFVRPLRLFLPSDAVRQIRIMLLRAVSIPFVALIWFYEGARRLFMRGERPPLAKMRSRPLSANKPFSSSSNRFRSAEVGTSSALKISERLPSHAQRSPSVKSAMSSSENADVIVLLQRLSAQVDALTTMVTAQETAVT